jgi:aromatic-amino-acid transaminase
MSSLFHSVELAPRDPILGLNEQFGVDTRTTKVNLGIGVYSDDQGRLPLLKSVHQAEMARVQANTTHGYLPIDGFAMLNQAAQILALGADSPVIAEKRALTVQSVGGTGALKIGADFLKQLLPNAQVAISNPSWENHRALFENAGFKVVQYPYYNAQTHGLDFDGMINGLKSLPAGTIIVLHACCHNPTGIDPTPAQWQIIAETVQAGQLVPFLDNAYQGFGQGLEEDAQAIRLFAKMGMMMFISSSYSKSFSLYGERIGALTVVAGSQDEAIRVLSQIKRVVRTNYSNPPTLGGAVVSQVLNTAELHDLWVSELAGMRDRIQDMRQQFVSKLTALGVKQNFDFVLAQQGMFSYSGLTHEQVEALRKNHGIYAVSTGRICVAALNSQNIDYVTKAVAAVL